MGSVRRLPNGARWEKPVWEAVRKRAIESMDPVCALCGKPIDMSLPAQTPMSCEVDHIIPKCRNNEVRMEKHLGGIGKDVKDNYNPSCRACNFYKGMLTVDGFRKKLLKELDYKHTFATKMAIKYGILEEHEWNGKFYFEKQ